MKTISIIIPAFNEAERISPTIRDFSNLLIAMNRSHEILVVDDGSTDETAGLIEKLSKEIAEVKLIPSVGNFGKGHAVRRGMLIAKGDIRLFADADGATPAAELEKFITPIEAGEADLAIGTRYHPSSIIDKAQPRYRVIWSRIANKFVQRLLLPGIADPNCGFKAFRGIVAQRLFEPCQTDEWSFDLEILSLARQLNYQLLEIPIRWRNDERSKGKVSDLPKEIRNLIKIKRNMKRLSFT